MPDQATIDAAVEQEAAEAVAAYLHAIASVPVSVRLREIEEQFWTAQPLVRFRLAEERKVLRDAHDTAVARAVEPYQADFIALAKIYTTKHDISYRALRRSGVPKLVLARAGIRYEPLRPRKPKVIRPFGWIGDPTNVFRP
jgi:hypothetical protein